MNSAKKTASRSIGVALCATVVLLGCGRKPSQANIQLRKQIQDLESQISELKLQHEGDAARIRSLEQGVGTIPTIPQDRLDQLFTVHGIKFGRLTGGADLDPSKPGDEGLKVYVVPIDQQGDAIKASGSFVIEAFDLSMSGENRLGSWEIPIEQASQNWSGELLMYTYALTLPWDRPPQGREATVRMTFRDALTGREFIEQKVVKVEPPGSTPDPATSPAVSG